MNPKILVVEDEFIIALDIKNILESAGYEVMVNVNTFEKAICAINNFKPDLVLLDINLNEIKDGVDLGIYLNKLNQIPFVYITSYYDEVTLDRVCETRPSGFIVKPFKSADILSIITITLNNYKHKAIDIDNNELQNTDLIPLKLKEVINFINQNIDRKIEIKELVELTKWKTDHFTRIFSQYLNKTPYQYILHRKIEKAKCLLSQSDLPIKEIAFELGFKS